jgi:peptidyl-prolyl cis-trans isomerase B (cyclophilin B)
MSHKIYRTLAIVATACAVGGCDKKAVENPQVILETSSGKIILELYSDRAPETVKNFIAYIDSEFYNDTVFHRVIPNFMIQGGGFTADMKRKPTQMPIKNEADNGLKNDRGTIAMARTADPDSATAQFSINSVNNEFLNHKSKDSQGWGYAVFGRVIEGMDVVDAIAGVETGTRGAYRDVPIEPVVISKAQRIK